MQQDLIRKQKLFNEAIVRYETQPVYKWTGKLVSFFIVSLQCVVGWLAFQTVLPAGLHLLVVISAYIMADLINGLVHIYMDRKDDYASPLGPFAASFHLHHRTPVYKKNNIIAVYYNESGSKIWLGCFMILAVWILWLIDLPAAWIYGLFYFSLFSSIAEVSHYLCHTTSSPIAFYLSKSGLLLSKKHHSRHHMEDNVSYAFLNGMTDPLLNIVARFLSTGYKQTTDLHYGTFQGRDTENR